MKDRPEVRYSREEEIRGRLRKRPPFHERAEAMRTRAAMKALDDAQRSALELFHLSARSLDAQAAKAGLSREAYETLLADAHEAFDGACPTVVEIAAVATGSWTALHEALLRWRVSRG